MRLLAVPELSKHVIREIAHAYATAKRAIICWTLGITEHHTAVHNVLSLINLSLLRQLAVGSTLPDAVVTLGSIDIVVGEIDR